MMYFKKSPDPMGEYLDAAGNRFSIAAARRIRTADGVNVGYIAFDSLQDAMEAWGFSIVPIDVAPENRVEVAP